MWMKDGILVGKLLKAAKHHFLSYRHTLRGKEEREGVHHDSLLPNFSFPLDNKSPLRHYLEFEHLNLYCTYHKCSKNISSPFPIVTLVTLQIKLHVQLTWFPPDLLIPHGSRDDKVLDQIFISTMNSDYLPVRIPFWLRNSKTATQRKRSVSALNANFIFMSR